MSNQLKDQISIRDARVEDAPLLSEAERQVASVPGRLISRPHELTDSAFLEKIDILSRSSNGKYIVAELNNAIIGHAMLDPMNHEVTRHIVRLTIVVHSGFEGRGIGERMLTHLIAWARSCPEVEKIELHVRASNLRAVHLYQKCGFHFEGRLRNRVKHASEQYDDDFEMGLFLRAPPKAQTIICMAIGKVISTRKEMSDDQWDKVESQVQLDDTQLSPEALIGIEEFSHVEILFQMNQVEYRKIETSSRHPRNNEGWPKVGIFAQRGKNRPNQIGSTICRLVKVKGLTLHVEGLYAIDGTPVLDVKPWVQEFGPRGTQRQPKWMSELMKNYW